MIVYVNQSVNHIIILRCVHVNFIEDKCSHTCLSTISGIQYSAPPKFTDVSSIIMNDGFARKVKKKEKKEYFTYI